VRLALNLAAQNFRCLLLRLGGVGLDNDFHLDARSV
jgi:hypothetical protein